MVIRLAQAREQIAADSVVNLQEVQIALRAIHTCHFKTPPVAFTNVSKQTGRIPILKAECPCLARHPFRSVSMTCDSFGTDHQ